MKRNCTQNIKKTKLRTVHSVYVIVLLLLWNSVFATENKTCFSELYEKVYVHLDKNVYSAGSKIRHKAFLVTSNPDLDLYSKVLYFEISGENGVYFNWRLNIENNAAQGIVSLPDTIPTGIYQLRAYTNVMRNYYDSYLYKRELVITNVRDVNDHIDQISHAQAKKAKASFKLDGNCFVSGYKSILGYADCQPNSMVELKNSSDTIIASSQANNRGYGNLTFMPQLTETYVAYYTDNMGKTRSFNLPEVTITGYKLSVQVKNSTVGFKIQHNITDESAEQSNLMLLVESEGKQVLARSVSVANEPKTIWISKNELKQGINAVKLVSGLNEVVQQTLFYIADNQPIPELLVDIKTKVLTPREKGECVVSIAPSMNEKLLRSVISIAETDTVFDIDKSRMEKALFHLAGLRYNQFPNDYTENELNKWLYSYGFTDYIWNDKQYQEKKYTYFKEDHGYILKGRVISKTTGLGLKNRIVCISLCDTTLNLKYTKSDSLGDFYFHINSSFDNKNLYFQLLNSHQNDGEIAWRIHSKLSQSDLVGNAINLSNEQQFYLDNYNKIALAEKAFSSHEKDIKLYKKVHKSFFSLKPEQLVYPRDFVSLKDFKEISQNILTAVRYRCNKKTNTYSLSVYESTNTLNYNKNVGLFINGVYVKDMSLIKNLSSDDILKLEIIRSRIFYGDIGFDGIVHVVTYNNELLERYVKRNILTFYNSVPNGSHTSPIGDIVSDLTKPDFRQTLYWNPNAVFDKNQNITIPFRASDLTGNYKFKVSGITDKGNVINAYTTFEVKK